MQPPMYQQPDGPHRALQIQTKPPYEEAFPEKVRARSDPTDPSSRSGSIRVRLPSVLSLKKNRSPVSSTEERVASEAVHGVPVVGAVGASNEDMEAGREIMREHSPAPPVQIPREEANDAHPVPESSPTESSRLLIGDVRLEPDFTGTVVIRRPARRGAIPAIWRSPSPPNAARSDDRKDVNHRRFRPRESRRPRVADMKLPKSSPPPGPPSPRPETEPDQPPQQTGAQVDRNKPKTKKKLNKAKKRPVNGASPSESSPRPETPNGQPTNGATAPPAEDGRPRVAKEKKKEKPDGQSKEHDNGSFRGLPQGFFPFPRDPPR